MEGVGNHEDNVIRKKANFVGRFLIVKSLYYRVLSYISSEGFNEEGKYYWRKGAALPHAIGDVELF